MSLNTTETIATFTGDDDQEYEIDHLGITSAAQWGDCTVYRNRKQLARFAIPATMLKPRRRPTDLPVSSDELVVLAKAAVAAAGGA